MPAYNFKPQFAPYIQRGDKTQTIRRARKQRPTAKGDRLFLYTGMRQPGCRLLLETVCTGALPVLITEEFLQTAHRRLAAPDADRFARADGFPSFFDMQAFSRKHYGLPSRAECLSWRAPAGAETMNAQLSA